jgi:hypothetical protein
LDTNGNFNWALKLGDSVRVPNVANDIQNNVYVSSGFSSLLGPIDADPGPNVFNLATKPDNDMYIFKLDTNSNFIWAFNYGDGGRRVAFDLLVDSSNKIYYCGRFNGWGVENFVDLNPFAADTSFSISNTSFTIKLSQTGTLSTQNFTTIYKNLVYPNPANNEINLSFENNLENANLKIISILGQTVLEKQNISGNNFSVDVSGLTNGTYIIHVNNNNSISTSRFIKQ